MQNFYRKCAFGSKPMVKIGYFSDAGAHSNKVRSKVQGKKGTEQRSVTADVHCSIIAIIDGYETIKNYVGRRQKCIDSIK